MNILFLDVQGERQPVFQNHVFKTPRGKLAHQHQLGGVGLGSVFQGVFVSLLHGREFPTGPLEIL